MFEHVTLLMRHPLIMSLHFFQLQVHTQINDVLSNLRNAAEENTLLGNNYFIDVNSMTLTDRKSR